MSIRCILRGSYLIFTLVSAAALCGQTESNGGIGSGSLGQHYNEAQALQSAGKLREAAEQYRAFIGDALGQLALGYGLARDYSRAASLFDEALTLEPDSASLLLDYARTALLHGDLTRAEKMASQFIQKYPGDRAKLGEAHQVLGRALLKLNRDQEARKEFEAAVALNPTFSNGYDLAVACLDLGDEKGAVQIFAEMEESFGDTPEIHMAFGRAFGDSDFQPRALAEFSRAIEESPSLPGAHYLLAAILLATGGDEGHLEDAEAELKKESVISPHDPMTYAALGKIALTRNNYPQAETYLKKAISLGPSSPDAYLYLGQMYFETNRSAEAETALRQCIRLTTDVSQNRYQVQKAHFFLGRIMMQKGQQDAAHAEMAIARDLANKALSQDKNKLAGLLNTSVFQDAQVATQGSAAAPPFDAAPADPTALDKTEELRERVSPPIADSYNNLGAIAATNHDYSHAVTYFKHAAVWNPLLEGLDYNWGRAAFAGSQFADAIAPLSRFVKSHPEDAGARSVLGISQFMTDNYQGCIETLESAIGKADLAPQAEYVYAESMIRSGRIASGVERMETLEKLHPEIPDVHRALGEALVQQGDKQQALEELRTAIRLSPGDADSHYDLGKMELESGNTAAAIQELEAAARLFPNNEKFHQELADAYAAALRPTDAQRERETCNLLRARVHSSSSLHQGAAAEQ